MNSLDEIYQKYISLDYEDISSRQLKILGTKLKEITIEELVSKAECEDIWNC